MATHANLRYERRKQVCEQKARKETKQYDDFQKVFSWEHLWESAKKCYKGVGWKCSTQLYHLNALINVCKTHNTLINGTYKSRGFYEFDLMERGKLRHIKSIHISERVVHKCLCDYSLVPMLSRTFIYDNGACVKGKGINFAINRFKTHLQNYYRHYGAEGYILKFDFSKYFDNINHAILINGISEHYTDQRLKDFIARLINAFGTDKGLGLGSQVSQIAALFYCNGLDHLLKEKLHIKYYGRYMDDGYLIHPDKEHLRMCLKEIQKYTESLGLTLNKNKTQIIKLSGCFEFLKKKTRLTESGEIIMRIPHKYISSKRRRLRKLKERIDEGTYTKKQLDDYMLSIIIFLLDFDAMKQVKNLINYYKELVGDKDVKNIWGRIPRNKRRAYFAYRWNSNHTQGTQTLQANPGENGQDI